MKRRGGLKAQGTKGYVKKWKKDKKKTQYEVTIAYSPQICPDIMRVSLPYSYFKTLNAIGGLDDVIRANSAFDPEFAVGGGQPIGFDQWSALYRRYRVLACKIDAQFQNKGASASAFVVPMNTSSSLVTGQQIVEQQGSKRKMLTPSNNGNAEKIVYYKDTASMRGCTRDAVRSEIFYSALTSGNPTTEWYFHIGGYTVNPLDTLNIDVDVLVTYYIEFFDRETLIRS